MTSRAPPPPVVRGGRDRRRWQPPRTDAPSQKPVSAGAVPSYTIATPTPTPFVAEDDGVAKEAANAALRDAANRLYAACRNERSPASGVVLAALKQVLDSRHARSAVSPVVDWALRRALQHHNEGAVAVLLEHSSTRLSQSLVLLACLPPSKDDAAVATAIAARCASPLAATTLAGALDAIIRHQRPRLLEWVLTTYGAVLLQEKQTRKEVDLVVPDDRPRRFGRHGDDAEVDTKVILRRLPGVLDLALETALVTGWMHAADALVRAGATPYGFMLESCAKTNQLAALQFLATATTLPSEPSWVVWVTDALAGTADGACQELLQRQLPRDALNTAPH